MWNKNLFCSFYRREKVNISWGSWCQVNKQNFKILDLGSLNYLAQIAECPIFSRSLHPNVEGVTAQTALLAESQLARHRQLKLLYTRQPPGVVYRLYTVKHACTDTTKTTTNIKFKTIVPLYHLTVYLENWRTWFL